jgi:alkylation response protein AidB-like acyl-CoA dehydrogenase
MLIVDLHAPGVDIRPLRQMSGESHFNEVFLDDVTVPAENLCGGLNNGWRVLTGMLTHERIALSAGTTGGRMDRDSFTDLVSLARRRGRETHPAVRRALADLYIEQRLLDFMGQRMRAAAAAGLSMGPVGSIGKIGIARSARASAETAVLIGEHGLLAWEPGDPDAERWIHDLLFFPMTGIAGGTTEIQKNTVAERVLGLPRDSHPNRDVPFTQSQRNARS